MTIDMGVAARKNVTQVGSTEEPSDEQMFDHFHQKRRHMRRIIAVSTVLSLAVFGVVGYGVDAVLGTKPAIFIVAVVLSFPVNQMIIHRYIRQKLLQS